MTAGVRVRCPSICRQHVLACDFVIPILCIRASPGGKELYYSVNVKLTFMQLKASTEYARASYQLGSVVRVMDLPPVKDLAGRHDTCYLDHGSVADITWRLTPNRPCINIMAGPASTGIRHYWFPLVASAYLSSFCPQSVRLTAALITCWPVRGSSVVGGKLIHSHCRQGLTTNVCTVGKLNALIMLNLHWHAPADHSVCPHGRRS